MAENRKSVVPIRRSTLDRLHQGVACVRPLLCRAPGRPRHLDLGAGVPRHKRQLLAATAEADNRLSKQGAMNMGRFEDPNDVLKLTRIPHRQALH